MVERTLRTSGMPPYKKVRAEYARGASWSELGLRYGIKPQTLASFVKRASDKTGDQWPIRNYDHKAAYARRLGEDGRCVAKGLQLELANFIEWSGWTLSNVAVAAGLSRRVLQRIRYGKQETCAEETRDKVLDVIIAHEKRATSHKRVAS